jgi:superfamily II DNA or RNA helicase
MYILSQNTVYRVVGGIKVKDTIFLDEKRVYIEMLALFNKISCSSDIKIKREAKGKLKYLHEKFNLKFGDINSEKHKKWVLVDPRSTFLQVLTPQFYQVTTSKRTDIKGQYDIITGIQESWKKYKRVDESTLAEFLSDADLEDFKYKKGEHLIYIQGKYIPKPVFNSSIEYEDLRRDIRLDKIHSEGVTTPKWNNNKYKSIKRVILGDWDYDKSSLLESGSVIKEINRKMVRGYEEGYVVGFTLYHERKLLGLKGDIEVTAGLFLRHIDCDFVSRGMENSVRVLKIFENWVFGLGRGNAEDRELEDKIASSFCGKYIEYLGIGECGEEVAKYVACREASIPDPNAYKYFNLDKNINKSIDLYEHQKRAAVRVLNSTKSQILNHGVGSGKTWTAAIALIEGKRQGYFKRPAFIVPHLLIGQTREAILTLYPDARIYTMQTSLLNKPDYAERLEALFKEHDFDMIIMSTSQFNLRMGVPKEELEDIIQGDISLYKKGIYNISRKSSVRYIDAVEDKYKNREREHKVDLKELGIDKFFIDEAHVYFDQVILGATARVEGVTGDLKMAMLDFYYKTRYIARYTNNKGIVLLTGSPVDKRLDTMFVIETLLDFKDLKDRGEFLYDSWVYNYEQQQEIDVNIVLGENIKFKNKSGFGDSYIKRIKVLMDTVSTLESQEGLPDYQVLNTVTEISPSQRDLIVSIKEANELPQGEVLERYLTLGRAVVIHENLVLPQLKNYGEGTSPRVLKLVESVIKHYNSPSIPNSTQLILCDLGTPKAIDSYTKPDIKENGELYFNLYKHIKQKLVAGGIIEEDIAFLKDATTAKKKAKLFEDMNKGRVRVLLGDTKNAGTGANIQERLEVLHNLDVVSNHFKFEQRAGRIVRKGNLNDKVLIYNYISNQEVDIKALNVLIKQRSASEAIFKATISEGGSILGEFDYLSTLKVVSPNLQGALDNLEEYCKNINNEKQLAVQLSAYESEASKLSRGLGLDEVPTNINRLEVIKSGSIKKYINIQELEEQLKASGEIYKGVTDPSKECIRLMFVGDKEFEVGFMLSYHNGGGILCLQGDSRNTHIEPYTSDTNIISIALNVLKAIELKLNTLESYDILIEKLRGEKLKAVELSINTNRRVVNQGNNALKGNLGDTEINDATPIGNKIVFKKFKFAEFGDIYKQECIVFTAGTKRGKLEVSNGNWVLNQEEVKDLLVLGAYYGSVASGITHNKVYEKLSGNVTRVNVLGFNYLSQMKILPESYRLPLSKLDYKGYRMFYSEHIKLEDMDKALGLSFRKTMAIIIYRCEMGKGPKMYTSMEHLKSFKEFLSGYPIKGVEDSILELPEWFILDILRKSGIENVGEVGEDVLQDIKPSKDTTIAELQETATEVDIPKLETTTRIENEFWRTEIKDFAGHIYKFVKSYNGAKSGNVTSHRLPVFNIGNNIDFINVPAIDPVQRVAYSMGVVVKMAYSKTELDIKSKLSVKLTSLFLKEYASTKPKSQLEFAETCYSIARSGKHNIDIVLKER